MEATYEKNRLILVNKLLVKGRWVYSGGLILIGLISKITGAPNVNFPLWLMILLLTTGCVINSIYSLYLHYPKNITYAGIKLISFIQLTADFLMYLIINLYAGGLISISFIFFFYNIIASAFFYSLGGVLIICTIAGSLYSGLIILQYLKIIPFFSRYGLASEYDLAHNYSVVATNLFAIIVTFYIVGIFVGMIARSLRRSEYEIRIERDKEKAIIDNLNDGLIFVNKDGIVEFANERAEKLLNLNKKLILGKDINHLNFVKYKNLDLLFNRKQRKIDILNSAENPDINLKISTIEVKSAENHFIGTVKIIQDISREKFVDKMKSEFIMIAGHQLRTPLSAVKSGLSLLMENAFGKVSHKQKDVLGQCYDNNDKLIKLIDDLLEVYSVEEGKSSNKSIKTDMKELLEKIGEKFKLEAKNKNIKFNFEISRNLPELELDPYKIRLALTSLIDNSFRYTPENGEIKVNCGLKDGALLIKVIDNGIGIDKNAQEKLFSKFYRADNAITFQTEGNGLGLYVVKNIIENHGGRVWFKSKLNHGSTFYVKLPVTS